MMTPTRIPALIIRCLLLSAVVLGSARIANAQPVPTLTNIPPAYLKQGESREVELIGQTLSGAIIVLLPDPRGVEASILPPKEPPATRPNTAPAAGRRGRGGMATQPARPTDRVRLRLSAAADAPAGVRELRLAGPLGVTTPVLVAVGPYPAVDDAGGNNSPEGAQAAELPAAIVGRIETPGDVDCYRFDARAGAHLIFDVHAARLGSPLQPVVTIHDARGRELPHADEFHGGDPMAVFDVPADGSYILQIHDLQFRGGPGYGYRIDAGPIPYVESLLPATGRRGRKVEVTATGHNLGAANRLTLDLTDAEPGPLPVRVTTPAGVSNEVTFTVTDVNQVTATGVNHTPAQAAAVTLPADITGVLNAKGAEDFYAFRVPTKAAVTLAVEARRAGSPVDALLTLATAKGDVVEQSNGSGDAEARISKTLDPGDYVASIRDLTYGGGPGYSYRLSIARAGGMTPDFSVRFLPDAPRLARGGSVKLWCEVVRANGYKGEVAVALDGLPPGVTAGPAVMGDATSGVFTLSAAPDAALGVVPFSVKATGVVGGQEVTRTAEPELGGRAVRQAYLTVLEPAPVAVEAVALMKPEQLRDYGKQVAELYAKLNAPTPALEVAQAAWEKAAAAQVEWKTLEPSKLTSAASVTLAKQPDGSILAGGKTADKDTYTITAETDLKGITAVRLEALTDPSLPMGGPGRPPNGNFVVSKFAVAAAPKSDPAKVQPLPFNAARATFEQAGFPAAAALAGRPGGGWAVAPESGKPQTATFFAAAPADFDGGTVLTFTLDHLYGQQHTLGKFRLSVTTDPDAAKKDAKPLPAPILAIVKVPADGRTAGQKALLAAYYRTIAPELAADRGRLDALRNGVGPYAEIARLEGVLNANPPDAALAAEQREWEGAALAGGWTPLDVGQATAANGTLLVREADGSYAATGDSPAGETYTLAATTPLKGVTAVKIEGLPDERYPANGPGRGAGGNFILTRVQLAAAPRAADGKTGPAAPIEFRTARATIEQRGWPAVGALDDRPDTGWGIAPNAGRPAAAVFVTRLPVPSGDGGTALTLTLEQQSNQPQHTIGRFRVYATSSPNPEATPTLPAEVTAVLKTPAAQRNDEQRVALAAYFRSVAPSLPEIRERLAELKAKAAPLPLTVARNKAGFIPVPLARTGDTDADVLITLEGFTAGRDPATKMPAPVAKNLAVNPLTIKAGEAFGRLTFRVNPNSELGTRMVVLRAETKMGGETYVEYSPAFPLTVVERLPTN